MNYNNRTNQKYEDYWKFTAGKTDFFSGIFEQELKIIYSEVKNKNAYDSKDKSKYKSLQDKIIQVNSWTGSDPSANARKDINTFVKLGFFSSQLKNYHQNVPRFLGSRKRIEKETLLAEIFYCNNNLCGSVVTTDTCKKNRIKFLINTLQENKKLSKKDLAIVLLSDPDDYRNYYISKNELKKFRIENSSFIEEFAEDRKYNQIGHLRSFLKVLKNYIIVGKEDLYFASEVTETERIFRNNGNKPPRNMVEQEIYRDKLILESQNQVRLPPALKNWRATAMSTGLDISRSNLVASHIWPYRSCKEESEFDPNNGLLLDRDRDYFFDQGLISFEDNGNILIAKNNTKVSSSWRRAMKNDNISVYLNSERRKYLRIHRVINGFEKLPDNKLKELYESV